MHTLVGLFVVIQFGKVCVGVLKAAGFEQCHMETLPNVPGHGYNEQHWVFVVPWLASVLKAADLDNNNLQVRTTILSALKLLTCAVLCWTLARLPLEQCVRFKCKLVATG